MPTKTDPKPAAKPDDDEATILGEAILDLDTLVPERPTVRIKTPEDREGKLYEMHVPDEFGIEDEQVFRAELREFSQLVGKDKLNSAERKQLKARLNELCRKVIIAPQEVLDQLNDRQRQAVVTNFTGKLFAEDAAAVDQAMQARLLSSITES